MMNQERRYLPQAQAQVEIRDDGEQKITGYAAVFWRGEPGTEYTLWEGAVERILPGAFDRVLQTSDARALFNHDPNQLLGRQSAGTLRLSVDSIGLRYEITPGKTHVAADVIEHLRRRDLTGSSFAFVVGSQNWRTGEGIDVREIVEVAELWDVGPVTFPAYTATSSGLRQQQLAELRMDHRRWRESLSLAARLAAVRARAIEILE
jgi:HK97 family phage prohead protease